MSSIESLSDQQAIQALKLFYDLLPDHAWEGGRKPSPERIQTLAADLREEAPAEFSRFLNVMLDNNSAEGDVHARSSLCRILLASFHDSQELRVAADQAVEEASKLDMCIIDPVTGTFIVFLALAVIPRIEKGRGGLKIIPAAGLEAMLKALPPVLSALPKELYAAIAARMGD
jgi:hypothetical protein